MNLTQGMKVGNGRYTLDASLGGTEDAETWRALDGIDGTKVAVKFLDPSLTEDARLRFEEKCRDTRGLAHIAGVVPLHDYFGEQDRLVLVSPFIASATYRSLWAGSDTHAPWSLAVGLVEAVAMLHQAQLHHGRLCPNNVLQGGTHDDAHTLARTERLRSRMHPTALLTDHWVAAIVGSGAGWGRGHSAYLAPEQLDWENAEARATGGRAADVWALGVMLCEIFTGNLPYKSEDRGTLKQYYDARSSSAQKIRAGFQVARETSDEANARPEIAELVIECLALDDQLRGRLSAAEILTRLKDLEPRPKPVAPQLHLALRDQAGALVKAAEGNRLALGPSQEGTLTFEIENEGGQNESLTLKARWTEDWSWARVEPGDLTLAGHGQKRQVLVGINIPEGPKAPPGEHVLALEAKSLRDSTLTWRQECAVVAIAPFVDLQIRPEPSKQTGKKKARFSIELENRGNVPTTVELGSVPSGGVSVSFPSGPARTTHLAPGVRARVEVVVSAGWKLTGSPVARPAKLRVAHSAAEVPKTQRELELELTQEALIGKKLGSGLGAAAAALIALWALWPSAHFMVGPGHEPRHCTWSGPYSVRPGEPKGTQTGTPSLECLEGMPVEIPVDVSGEHVRLRIGNEAVALSGSKADWKTPVLKYPDGDFRDGEVVQAELEAEAKLPFVTARDELWIKIARRRCLPDPTANKTTSSTTVGLFDLRSLDCRPERQKGVSNKFYPIARLPVPGPDGRTLWERPVHGSLPRDRYWIYAVGEDGAGWISRRYTKECNFDVDILPIQKVVCSVRRLPVNSSPSAPRVKLQAMVAYAARVELRSNMDTPGEIMSARKDRDNYCKSEKVTDRGFSPVKYEVIIPGDDLDSKIVTVAADGTVKPCEFVR